MEILQGERWESRRLERTLLVSGFRNVHMRVHGAVHRLQYLPELPNSYTQPRSATGGYEGRITMEQLSMRLLGAPQVAYGGRPVSLRLHKELALLIYLAVTSRPHTRIALATLLWPDHDERSALAALRRTIYQLKVDIGESVLEITPNLVRLRPDVPLWLDTQQFSNAMRHCAGHEHPPDAPFASCVAILEDGINLYADDFLSGFSLPDSEAFDEWQFFEREGLRTEYVRVLALLTTYYEQHEAYDKAIETARRWLGREPYHEPAHRALIRLYAVTGQQAAAKRQYDTCKRILAGQLGVRLDQETERLYQSLGDPQGGSTSRPQPQYTRNGDVYLAYQTIGAGAVDVLTDWRVHHACGTGLGRTRSGALL